VFVRTPTPVRGAVVTSLFERLAHLVAGARVLVGAVPVVQLRKVNLTWSWRRQRGHHGGSGADVLDEGTGDGAWVTETHDHREVRVRLVELFTLNFQLTCDLVAADVFEESAHDGSVVAVAFENVRESLIFVDEQLVAESLTALVNLLAPRVDTSLRVLRRLQRHRRWHVIFTAEWLALEGRVVHVRALAALSGRPWSRERGAPSHASHGQIVVTKM